MSDLYHIYIAPKSGVTRQQVEAKLNAGIDWFRYHDRCYVVETTSNEDKWQQRLQPLVEPDGYLFICKFAPRNYQGWMSKDFWEWFEGKLKKTP